MKKLVLAGALVVGAAAPASALDVWQGDVFITQANVACRAEGVNANDFLRAIYRPADVGENGPDARLSIVGTRNAHRYAVTGPLSARGTYSGQIISSTAGFVSWTNSYAGVKVKPAPTVNTPTLTLTAKITQFASLEGCVVVLSGALAHRPGLE